MTSPRSIRWGILATGGIATTFTKDLTIDPKTRNVTDIKHEVVAAASSSSAGRAQEFLNEVAAGPLARAYGSYEELVQDPNVDIVYVATPHSHHFQNVMLCLEAGKNVLCEKAFTVNAAQLKVLTAKAREKKLFLMEAIWTRYFPLSIWIREQITNGTLGTVHRVFADLASAKDPEQTWPDGMHRIVNPDLAGGALLDMGMYALTWCFQTLYHTQPEGDRQRPTVVSAVKKYAPTGADEAASMVLTFPRSAERGGDAHAIATTSIRVATDPGRIGTLVPAVRIQGDKGEIMVYPHPSRPTLLKLVTHDGRVEEKKFDIPGPGPNSGWRNGFDDQQSKAGEGWGMFWEADDAARALVEGRKEGSYEGLDESILFMEIMDQVRKDHGVKYPEEIESTQYPLKLKR